MKNSNLLYICGFLTLFILGHSIAYANTSQQKGRVVGNQPTKTYKVPGIAAWSAAKSQGFKFYPEGARGNKDGVNGRGKISCFYPRTNKWTKIAGPSQMVGGVNMIIEKFKKNTKDCQAKFFLFAGKNLAPGWKIKSMRLSGPYQYTSKKWRANTDRIMTEIMVTQSGAQTGSSHAMLKEIILEGPANSNWQNAFAVN